VLRVLADAFPLGRARGARPRRCGSGEADLYAGFGPIACATPTIVAHPMGGHGRHGLDVGAAQTAGGATDDPRDQEAIAREHDAARTLSPVPLAMGAGSGG
jgi:hypothetical protein